MSTGSVFLWLAIVAVFLVLNGLFVAAEYALVSLRKSRVDEMVRSGVLGAGVVRSLKENLERSVAGSQLGITISSLIVGWLGERSVAVVVEGALHSIPGLDHIGVPAWVGFILTFTLLTTFHILIGEQVPKFIGIRFPESTILKLGPVYHMFCRIVSPFLTLMNFMANGVIKLLRIDQSGEAQLPPSEDEFKVLVAESRKAKLISKQQSDLLIRALALSNLTVRQTMLPLPQVDFLRVGMSLRQVLAIAVDTKHTKFPVFAETDNTVIGILNTKDLFEVLRALSLERDPAKDDDIEGQFVLNSYVRQCLVVADSMKAGNLLEEMRTKHQQMAVVVDEFGNPIGLITLEDLVEKLVGDIRDEYDTDQVDIQKTSNNTWKLSGKVTIFEFNQKFETELECDGGNCSTVVGLVIEKLGRRARIGDSVTIGQFTFKVLEKEGHSVTSLEATRKA